MVHPKNMEMWKTSVGSMCCPKWDSYEGRPHVGVEQPQVWRSQLLQLLQTTPPAPLLAKFGWIDELLRLPTIQSDSLTLGLTMLPGIYLK